MRLPDLSWADSTIESSCAKYSHFKRSGALPSLGLTGFDRVKHRHLDVLVGDNYAEVA